MSFSFSQKHIKNVSISSYTDASSLQLLWQYFSQMTIVLPDCSLGILLWQQCGRHCPGVLLSVVILVPIPSRQP